MNSKGDISPSRTAAAFLDAGIVYTRQGECRNPDPQGYTAKPLIAPLRHIEVM